MKLKKLRGRYNFKIGKAPMGDHAWSRGYSWAMRNGYKTIRDCRIVAMAFELGFKSGYRLGRKKHKQWEG